MREKQRGYVVAIATATILLVAVSTVFVAVIVTPAPQSCKVVEAREELALIPGVPIVGSTLTPPPQAAPPQGATLPPPVATTIPSIDIALVFTAGADTYVALEDIEVMDHGQPRLIEEAPLVTAIADVAPRDVPDAARRWLRAGVLVDGDCPARITGFAVVARLRGDPRIAIGVDVTEWTAESVMHHGNAVLAARIVGCGGTFARKATHPVVEMFGTGAAPFEAEARELLLQTSMVAEAQRAWEAAGNAGLWYEAEGATVDARVLEHPNTGEAWVLVHAYRDRECDQLGGDVLGLYRVDYRFAAQGRLVAAKIRAGGSVRALFLIDVDRDGAPELVTASRWSSSIERADGELLKSLTVIEYGGGC
jgi:hypothetical protein